jgi:hypothetical protein
MYFVCVVNALRYDFKYLAVNCCVLYAVRTEIVMFLEKLKVESVKIDVKFVLSARTLCSTA